MKNTTEEETVVKDSTFQSPHSNFGTDIWSDNTISREANTFWIRSVTQLSYIWLSRLCNPHSTAKDTLLSEKLSESHACNPGALIIVSCAKSAVPKTILAMKPYQSNNCSNCQSKLRTATCSRPSTITSRSGLKRLELSGWPAWLIAERCAKQSKAIL